MVSIHAPLHPQTYHLFDEKLIASMRRGSYIVNTARAEICVRDAVVAALKSGHLAGYAGDVWYPQPPPADHPWRSMPNEAMTPHVSVPRCQPKPATPPGPGKSSKTSSPTNRSGTNT